MNKRTLFAALALLPLFAQAEIKTIKDVLGREVKVDVPVKRAVLAFYYPDYIAVTGADKFKNVIGISREFGRNSIPAAGRCSNRSCLRCKTLRTSATSAPARFHWRKRSRSSRTY